MTPRTAGLALWRAADRWSGGRVHAFRWHLAPVPPVAAYCVYRKDNADAVHALVSRLPHGSTVGLHALDETDPRLAPLTRGVGPGARMPLLGSLIESARPGRGQPVLLFDDDVSFVGADVSAFIAAARAGAFDLAMPAHAAGSNWTFRVTVQRQFSTARRTSFVEVGPVVFLSPRAFDLVWPFPGTARMGWGLDVRWSALSERGLRLGVVDATPVAHHGSVAAGYDRGYEEGELARACAEVGVASPYELAHEVGRAWRPHRRSPGWASDAER